jgi:hypothetical protein
VETAIQVNPALSGLQVEIRSAHSDYPELVGLVKILQVLTPRSRHNKGTGLAYYLARRECPPSRIIHFGDSTSEQNSDATVSQEIPHAEFVLVGPGTPISSAESLAAYLADLT